MFKLVVLSALLAVACAKPYAPLAYSSLVAPVHVAPTVYGAHGLSAYSAPLVSAYSHPLVSAYHAPAAYTPALAPGTPAVVQGLDGRPLDTLDVVNARAAHYTAKAFDHHRLYKRSLVAPIAYSSVVAAPTAVSHQSRVDVHSGHAVVAAPHVVSAYSSPLVSAYSSPLVSAYSSPLLSAYSNPLVSAYSSPLVSAYSAPLVSHYGAHAAPAYSVHPW